MSNFDDEHEKQELLRIASETKEIAHKVIEKGRNLTEACQSALDWAINIENFSHVAPSGFFRNPMLNHIVGGLREFNFVASRQYGQITEDESLTQIIHATATVTAVSSTSVAYISFGPKAEEIPELKSLEMLLRLRTYK